MVVKMTIVAMIFGCDYYYEVNSDDEYRDLDEPHIVRLPGSKIGRCWQCEQIFGSRNGLFTHLKNEGHYREQQQN